MHPKPRALPRHQGTHLQSNQRNELSQPNCCFAHQWAMVHDMKFKVYDLNPAVITNEQGRDIGWFFAGGAAEHTSKQTFFCLFAFLISIPFLF